MELDQLIEGTMKVFNCCDKRATDIVARYMNENRESELIDKILTEDHTKVCVDEKNRKQLSAIYTLAKT